MNYHDSQGKRAEAREYVCNLLGKMLGDYFKEFYYVRPIDDVYPQDICEKVRAYRKETVFSDYGLMQKELVKIPDPKDGFYHYVLQKPLNTEQLLSDLTYAFIDRKFKLRIAERQTKSGFHSLHFSLDLNGYHAELFKDFFSARTLELPGRTPYFLFSFYSICK